MVDIAVKKIDDKEIEEKGINSWDLWEKVPSEFDWYYTIEEHCYILEGKAEISLYDKMVKIEKGDYVILPCGLKCRWKVKEKLIKRYRYI